MTTAKVSMLDGGHLLSAVIMSHPDRYGMVERFIRSTPAIRFHLEMDEAEGISPDGALRTALRAWRSVPDAATHHLVLQDDVALCPDFPGRLSRAIDSDPHRVFSLFSEWGSKTAQTCRMAALSGCGWAAVADGFLPAPAVLMPAGTATDFAAFLADRVAAGEKRDAFLLFHFLRARGRQPQVCVPNLVQHDDPLRVSLLPNGKVRGPRRTACHPGPASPVEPWPRAAYPLPDYLPYHSPHDLVAGICSEPDAENNWKTEPAFAWFSTRGWSLSALDELFRDLVDGRCLNIEDEPLGYDSLKESVIAAFATGWALADGGHGDWRGFDPDEPTALQVAALGTMAAGAFRRVLSVRHLARLESTLPPLLALAVLRGMQSQEAALTDAQPCVA